MRKITTHHDGHGLAETIELTANDEPGPGGANHVYEARIPTPFDAMSSAAYPLRVEYQRGPRGESGSTPGVLDSVLLAIVQDRLQAFQAGPYSCGENASALQHVTNAMDWMKRRADERARRGVLGKNVK